jgi:phosphonate transport system substrate-binding protein
LELERQSMEARTGNRWFGLAALVVALAALVVAVAGFIHERQVAPLRAQTAEENKLFTTLTGLNNHQIANALDERYTDADGDLVADPPKDPAQLLDPPTLRFNYLADDTGQDFRAAFKELLAAVSKATGKPVEYVSYASTDDKLRALRDGRLAFGGLNTGSVPRGVCTAGFVPLCQAGDAQGVAGYQMQIIVPADSPLTKLSDLRGHELTLTDPNSNSGYKAPLVLLRESGMVPPTDYLIRYSHGQVQSIQGIKTHAYEAAAIAGDVLRRQQTAGHIAPGDYKVIYTSDQTFPDAAIGAAYNLKPELTAKIRAALLAFDWKGTGLEKLFSAEGKVRFVPTDYKKNWEYVRRIDDSIGYAYALPATTPATHPATKP